MNVLAIVAHPDDELLGCGATLRKLADAGHDVFSCILSANAAARHARPDPERLLEVSTTTGAMVGIADTVRYDFKNIEFNTVPHLEMVQAVEEAIVRFKPSWLFTHFPTDLNLDHRVAHEAAMAAAMLPQRLSRGLPVTMIQRIYLCEIPSSTDWMQTSSRGFIPNSFFDVGATLEAKMAALHAFDGALKPHPHSRSDENIRALARVRGAQVGIEYAEAFSLVRDVNQ
jgi:LmbE family N-acetylglucosaminyl deacetylase